MALNFNFSPGFYKINSFIEIFYLKIFQEDASILSKKKVLLYIEKIQRKKYKENIKILKNSFFKPKSIQWWFKPAYEYSDIELIVCKQV